MVLERPIDFQRKVVAFCKAGRLERMRYTTRSCQGKWKARGRCGEIGLALAWILGPAWWLWVDESCVEEEVMEDL